MLECPSWAWTDFGPAPEAMKEGCRCVTQLMRGEIGGYAGGGLHGRLPDTLSEVAIAPWQAQRGRKDQGLDVGVDLGREVRGEFFTHERGKRHSTHSVRLRRPEDEVAPNFGDGLGDVQAPAQEVAALAPQCCGFAPAQARVGEHEHHDPVPRIDGAGEVADLLLT